MTEATDRLKEIAGDLSEGRETIRVTVREFLSWFDAQRRGYSIVGRICDALKEAKLQTEPDFESAYLDSYLTFSPVPESSVLEQPPLPVPEADCTTSPLVPATEPCMSAPSWADPTYRISKLAAANRSPISLTPNATVQEAVTIMLFNDFSQCPL